MALSIAFRGILRPLRLTYCNLGINNARWLQTSTSHQAIKLADDEYLPGKWNNFKRAATALFSKKKYSRLEIGTAGENLYTICAEYPVYDDFIKQLNIQDSYQSWFSVTALHVWLCLVRVRSEGTEGRILMEILFKTLFLDIEKRTKGFHPADKARDMDYLHKQLYGALFAYDEGLLSNEDKILAASLWRDFFHMDPKTRAEDLELMVSYVRKQLQYLDNQSSDQIFKYGYIKFLPLTGDVEESFVNERLKYSISSPSVQELEKRIK